MPLVDMGLLRHVDTADAAPRRSRSAGDDADVRVLRCVAGFYREERNAAIVADALGARFGLRPTQLTVIRPSNLTRDGLARMTQRWQCLRPAQDKARQPWRLARGAATGLVSGGLAAMLGLLVAQESGVSVDALSWMAPGLWAGAIAGAVTSALAARRPQRHRFDRAVARQLRRGYSVVVAHGLGEQDEAPVLAYLQDTSHSWAAEAPQLRQRR